MPVGSRRGRLPGILVGSLALSFALSLAIAAPARAQARDPKVVAPPDTGAITPATIANGRAVFHGAGTCHVCHGERLEGTPIAPTLRQHKWRDAAGGTLPELYRVITTGVAGTAMVSHPAGISDAQALAVASYIWSVNNRGAKP